MKYYRKKKSYKKKLYRKKKIYRKKIYRKYRKSRKVSRKIFKNKVKRVVNSMSETKSLVNEYPVYMFTSVTTTTLYKDALGYMLAASTA